MPHHAFDHASLVDAADLAMYEVKRSGKNAFAMAAGRAALAPLPADIDERPPAFEPSDF